MRTARPEGPSRSGVHDGLAWAAYEPAAGIAPRAGVLVLHGAGSRKENQADFARAGAAAGLIVLTWDQRGHGASGGALDGRMVSDVVAMADLLRSTLPPGAPIGLRGTSMGGYLALVSAGDMDAAAVVAICPATATLLRSRMAEERYAFADPALAVVFAERDEADAAAALDVPVFLLHAENDEVVPIAASRALASRLRHGRFTEVPGGHHRSVQHDPELIGETVRWLSRTLLDR